MPVLTYDKRDLLNLIGKKLSDAELEDTINSIKPSVEKITKNEIIIEHTTDRIDLFGIEGLARAIRQYLGLGAKKYRFGESGLTIRVDFVKIRPFIASAVVREVKLNDELIKSLMNIQEVLHETIGRKRRKVAIGIHDLDKIHPPIVYTGVRKDSRIIPLEHSEEMTLAEVLEKVEKGRKYGKIVSASKVWPVFMDSKGIFSFPPIINSDRTKVTKKTRNLFIELTGIDKKAVLQTLNIIVTNLAERGCKIETVRLLYKRKGEFTPSLDREVIELEQAHVNKLLGLELTEDETIKILKRMGYESVKVNGKLEVVIPPYRVDILHPVDVIEDICIGYGYDKLSPELPNLATIGKPHPLEKLSGRVRNLMIGFGFQEVLRPILTNPNDQFDRMCMKREKVVELENPVSKEYTCLRLWVLPSLMRVLASNKHVSYPQRVFEVGDVVIPDEKKDTKSRTVRKLAFVLSHSKANYPEIKAIVEGLLRNLTIQYEFVRVKHPSFIRGRTAQIIIGEKRVGFFGEIHPLVLENWKLEMPVAACEINLEELSD